MRQMNDGWQFAKGEPVCFAPVELPHDWLIGDTNNLYESGIGRYKRSLDLGFMRDGQHVFLRFDGVYMDSTLFVNDIEVGEWKYGYTAFTFDITNFVQRDQLNTLLLKVNYQSPSARWYTGAGIYRDVFLIIKNACHFVPDGIYITTSKQHNGWHFEVDAEVETNGMPFELRHSLLNAEGKVTTCEGEITEWDVAHPYLYTVRSTLLADGQIVDIVDTRIGFRTTAFTTDSGFFLNGRHIKLNGVCLHHDLGALGAAVHPDAIRRQLTLLQQMGVNALRTAHNPPAKVFMELADEMGFLVMSEILDMWTHPKNKFDYARFFDQWIEKDVASWIRRDRNHPSVILWSVGNEIYDTHADAEMGANTLRRLLRLVRMHDPKEHAAITLCSNYMPWENTQKCADIVKLIGYNYAESLYEAHHTAHPDWIIYGSETCSTVQSRGVYHFPLSKSVLADDDLQCSALGNSTTSWGAKSIESCIQAERMVSYSLGQFIWAGQDHLGEPTPYHTKNSYLGHIDTAGFPKDSYYIFQAAWTDYRKTPIVHLFPHWDFSPGQMIDVRVCSNAPTVALFLDGESLGTVALGSRLIADFRLPYRPGTLRAIACDAQGGEIAEAYRYSFGDVASLQLHSETVGALVFATITAIDTDGYAVENANCRVYISVMDGTLLALDNGDATDFEQYHTDNRRLFHGKLLAIVKPYDMKIPHINVRLDDMDIPIRKIELAACGYSVTAQVYPRDATYRDLYWRLTDVSGIDSPLGSLMIAEDTQSVTVIPKGDGDICVRCSAKNGREHAAFISICTLTIKGMGRSFLNPYSFISGGLYNASNVELTNGNERGVATLRNGESHVCFKGLDFGSYGSDTFTLSLFPLSNEPFTFACWEGMPLEGGMYLCTVTYDKGSIWNTYQEITCKLPRRLRDITSLCFVFRQKVHIKGFQFTEYKKAFQRLSASEIDNIYGDSYLVKADAIENIGNNVSLVFQSMDFGSAGTQHVALSWRSGSARNSIQFIFAGEGIENRIMIEITNADVYTSAVFPLGERIVGEKTVTLIFLPGSDLDLAWLQFLA